MPNPSLPPKSPTASVLSEYVAVIVGEPEAVSEYVTPQLPELNVHGDPVNEPMLGSEVVKDTVPPVPPATVAVQLVVDPTVNEGHATDMVAAAAECTSTKEAKAIKPIYKTVFSFPIELPKVL